MEAEEALQGSSWKDLGMYQYLWDNLCGLKHPFASYFGLFWCSPGYHCFQYPFIIIYLISFIVLGYWFEIHTQWGNWNTRPVSSLTKQEPKEGEPKGVVYLGAELGDWDGFPINLVMEEQGISPKFCRFSSIFVFVCWLMLVAIPSKITFQLKSLILGFFGINEGVPDFRVFHIQMLWLEHHWALQRSYPWWFLRAAD